MTSASRERGMLGRRTMSLVEDTMQMILVAVDAANRGMIAEEAEEMRSDKEMEVEIDAVEGEKVIPSDGEKPMMTIDIAVTGTEEEARGKSCKFPPDSNKHICR